MGLIMIQTSAPLRLVNFPFSLLGGQTFGRLWTPDAAGRVSEDTLVKGGGTLGFWDLAFGDAPAPVDSEHLAGDDSDWGSTRHGLGQEATHRGAVGEHHGVEVQLQGPAEALVGHLVQRPVAEAASAAADDDDDAIGEGGEGHRANELTREAAWATVNRGSEKDPRGA